MPSERPLQPAEVVRAIGEDRAARADEPSGAFRIDPRPLHTEKKRILVVDDDVDIRDSLIDSIESAGYVVQAASNGAEALRILHTEYILGDGRIPHLILLDLMMPVMDGPQFYHVLQMHQHLRQIPIVVITAFPNEDKIPWVVSLAKPLDLNSLLETIAREARP